jgi:hypothetical protein
MLTIAALITPLTLAVAPMAITVEDQAKYSHQEQVVVSLNDEPIYNSTNNGTQTFYGDGKPYDSDSD